MVQIVYIGGLGPVELLVIGMLLLIPAMVAIWLYQHARDSQDRVEWHWVIGIVLLFLMGILPGLVGLWLYFASRDRPESASVDHPPSSAPAGEWRTGVQIFFGMAIGGIVVTVAFVEVGLNPYIGFVAGAVLAFFAIAYVFYGR